MSFIAAVSLLLSWLSARRAGVKVAAKRVRLFKEESRTVPVQVMSASSSLMSITSVSFHSATGISGTVVHVADGSTELVITPKLAGRSDKLVAVFEEVDILGLFAHRKEVNLGLVVESLPLALKSPADPLRVSPIAVGENPAGAVGTGQELFAVTEYQTGLDTRDIMWKRAARMSDDRIPMRVREANVKKVVTVGLAVTWRSDSERAARVDLIAEALAQVGKDLLLIGTTLEVEYAVGTRVSSILVSSLTQMADALVGPWGALEAGAGPSAFSRRVDLLIMGPDDPDEVLRQAELRPGRVLVVSDLPSGAQVPGGAVAFTGNEDLTELAAEVLAR